VGGVWRGVEDIPSDWGPCVVTIGVFDGIHRGHARLIARAVDLGRARGLPTALVTFDPHPARVVGPPRDTSALCTPARRADLAQDLGADAVLVLRFTPELAQVPAEQFVEHLLVDRLHASAVVVGRNFRFGHRGAGTLDTLRLLGRRWDFVAEGLDLVPAGRQRCSSTYVRACLSRGDLAAATGALGRPHRVEGRLAASGVLDLPSGTAVPAPGRYAGVLTVDGGRPAPVDVAVSPDRSVTVRGVDPATGGGAATLDFLPGPFG
jgi:riboflavin kinase/FMN adenylyltransferase